MFEFKMPSLGADMEKGRLCEWKVKEGDRVKRGDIVAAVETDKGVIDVEIWETGVVDKILVAAGSEVHVGHPLALIKIEGERPETNIATFNIQKTIAAAMVRSKSEIPHYYLSTKIDISNMLKWLEEFNLCQKVNERVLPVVPLLRALAFACGKYPEMNGHFKEGNFLPISEVNLGIAISTRQGGLVAPAILNASALNTAEMMKSLMELVDRTRSGKIRSSEMSEGTITVSNLGDAGAESILGIIYPPQVALVGVGSFYRSAVEGEKGVDFRTFVNVSLSGDHRVSNGIKGASFLRTVNGFMQERENYKI